MRRRIARLAILALVGGAALTVAAVADTARPASATTASSVASPDRAGDVGRYTSIALDAAGNPVVSYYDHLNGDLRLLHCNDPNCAGGDDSVTSPDTAGDVGQYTSLAIDSNGNPVVSYYDYTNEHLKVLHCDDPYCVDSGDSVTTPDASDDVGYYTSLALDAGGNPVVSHYDEANGGLRLLHCNDPNCAGGDESIAVPDAGDQIGFFTSLALDGDGNPVVSYFDYLNRDLRVLHCGDPACTANNVTSLADADAGGHTSLELDAGGNPVVSYAYFFYDEFSLYGGVKVLHCGDPTCTSGNSIVLADIVPAPGQWTSLALDSAGNPVVAHYYLNEARLRIVRCGDANCSTSNAVISLDTPGGLDVSLTMDGDGNPVASYYDALDQDLRVLRCAFPDCDLDGDDDGCSDALELEVAAGSEMSGGRRDPKNQWDYFNPTEDGQNRIDDVLAVVGRYFVDVTDPPSYSTQYDRTYLGPNPWNLGPPDGMIRIGDVLAAVAQYFHDCS